MHEVQNQLSRPLQLFLCHSTADKPAVRGLYRRLRSDGFDPWLDEEDILPGQDWKQEIEKEVRTADVFLVCLSRVSIGRDGFAQKEIKFALDVADEKPEGTIFMIPIKLEECEVPDRLRRWHWVSLFEDRGYEKLAGALQERASTLGLGIPCSGWQIIDEILRLLEELETADKQISLGDAPLRLTQVRHRVDLLVKKLEAAGKEIRFGDVRVFEVLPGTTETKSIVLTSDVAALSTDWGSYVLGSGKLPDGDHYLIFARKRMQAEAKKATTDTVWVAPVYRTRTAEGKATTTIGLPTGTLDISRFKAQVPSQNLKVPTRIVLAAEGDAKPINTTLGAGVGPGPPSWTAPKVRFAEPPERRGPFLFFTKNISRGRKHLDIVDTQEPFRAGQVASFRVGTGTKQNSNLDELWFAPQRGEFRRALVIYGENAAEIRKTLKQAAYASLLRNKQIALVTSFDPRETDALREILLDAGALMVWTPEHRISPEVADKLRDYMQKVDLASTDNPVKSLDDYIERAMELWYRDSPDDADLALLLNASRWV